MAGSGPGVELLFGPMLIGVLLSTLFFGVMAVQMFIYFQTYKKDSPWIRYFILYLFIVESANVLFEIGIIYEPLIIRNGSQEALITSPFLLPADAISIVMISAPIQVFTAWRIKVITSSVLLAVFISIFAGVSFVGGALVSVFSGLRNEFREFQSFSGVVTVWLVSSAVCDVLIAVVLTYSLSTRKTGFTAVDGQINRIIRLTVQTGAITAVAAILDLVLFLVFPQAALQFIPDFPLSKFYSICLVSTLNARARGKTEDAEQRRLPNVLFKETGSTGVSTSYGLQDMRSTGGGTVQMYTPTAQRSVSLHPAHKQPDVSGQVQAHGYVSASASVNTLVAASITPSNKSGSGRPSAYAFPGKAGSDDLPKLPPSRSRSNSNSTTTTSGRLQHSRTPSGHF